VWTGIAPTASFVELRLNSREYEEMPPEWRRYEDAEDSAGDAAGFSVQKRIDFILPTLDGQQVSLSSDRFKGKVVLVNIFGSWCGGCRSEMPYLVCLQKKYAAQGLEVIGLAFEQESEEAGKANLREFMEQTKVNYTILFGGPTKAENVLSTIKGVDRFHGYPTTILLGRDGQVQYTEVGVKAETKARTDWWSRRLEGKVANLLKDAPEK
jgi:thiol-disulfide isomerase/thioredoxin